MVETGGHCPAQNRRLGGIEYAFKDTVAVTEIGFTGPLDSTVLGGALAQLLAQNPILACKMIKKGFHYYFEHDAKIGNILRVLPCPKGDVPLHIEQELGRSFELGTPLVRFTLLVDSANQATLLAAFNHAIYDGVSLAYFINCLVGFYGAILRDDSLVNGVQITQPLEGYIKYKKTWSDYKSFLGEELPVRLKKRAIFPFHGEAIAEDRSTRSIYRRISAELTAQIMQASRKARTTPHGAIMAAILFSMAKMLPNNKLPFTVENDIDMRGQNQINKEQIGVYVSGLCHRIPVDDTVEFWKFAKECRKNLSIGVKQNLHIMAIAAAYPLMKYTPEFVHEKVRNGPFMGRIGNLCISNLGSVNINEDGAGIVVEKIVSHVAIHDIGSNFGLIPLDFKGQTGFNLLYVKPLTSDEDAHTVMVNFLSLLAQCVEEKEFWPLK